MNPPRSPDGEKLAKALEEMGAPAVPPTLILDLLQRQIRTEEKIDTILGEQTRARNQREQMFERFDKAREQGEQAVRRMDGIERDVTALKADVSIIKKDVGDHKDVRLQAQGAIWIIRSIMLALAGGMGAAVSFFLTRMFR